MITNITKLFTEYTEASHVRAVKIWLKSSTTSKNHFWDWKGDSNHGCAANKSRRILICHNNRTGLYFRKNACRISSNLYQGWGQFSSDHIPFVSIPWFFRPSTLFKWHFVVFHHYFLMTSTLALKFLPISFAGNIPPFSTEIGHFRAKCFSFEKQCFNENFTYVFNKVSSISRDLLSVLSMNVL